MRFRNVALTTAFLAALTVANTFTAHADSDSNSQPKLAVETVCGQSAHVFDIRNVGTVTTARLNYTLCAGASEIMPPLKTWSLPLFPLAPGEVFQLSAPSSAWGLKVWLKVYAPATGTQAIASSPSATPYPNFCW